MTIDRRCIAWPAVLALVALLSACGSTPKRADTPTATKSAGSGAPPTKRGGGYYLDDGPGDTPPANLEYLPDAVPRVEKYASGANRPYNVFGVDYVPDLSGKPYKQRGTGSWYGRKFHGQRTSNGEIYDMYAMTAAHPTLPLPSYALVTNLTNGKSVIVRVNDRGPFLHNRIMDLSYAAALKVGYLSSGSGQIEVEMLMPADIAAGRIPQTTTSLLLASMPAGAAPVTATPSPVASAPVTSTVLASTTPPSTVDAPSLTIEQLTARDPDAPPLPATGVEPAGPSLPPAPRVVSNASTPIAGSIAAAPAPAPTEPIALPDQQPPAKLPETATKAGFYLQLGAFRGKAGADSFVAHLSRLIDPSLASRVQTSEANGLYRVRVGPYAERTEADQAAASLRAAISQPVLVMPGGGTR